MLPKRVLRALDELAKELKLTIDRRVLTHECESS
jgi:hypothetical protein